MEPYLSYLDAEKKPEQVEWLANPKAVVRTASYERAVIGDQPFICGRKGAGKSAVAYLIHDIRRFPCHVHVAGEDYEQLYVELLASIRRGVGSGEMKPDELEHLFFAIWKYALTVAVLQACLELDPAHGQRSAWRQIDSYFSTHGWRAQAPARIALLVARKFLKYYSTEHQPATLPLNLLNQILAVQEEPQFVAVQKCARKLADDTDILITIDSLERYDLEHPDDHALIGMCAAVESFVAKQPFPNVVVKCFLPSELTEYLFTVNRAKSLANSVSMEWSYSELLELIGRRYGIYLTKHARHKVLGSNILDAIQLLKDKGVTSNKLWRDRVWRLFAPSTVRNRKGWEEDACAYVLRHTQRRPRECLCCMNHIIERAVHEPEFPKIGAESLRSGLHAEDNLDMLMSDNLTVFPVPGFVGRAHNLIAHVADQQTSCFPAKSLARMIERSRGPLHGRVRDVRSYVEELLRRSGLVGVVRDRRDWVDSSGRPCRYFVTHFCYSGGRPLQLSEGESLAMHPILADYVQARKTTEIGVVYPLVCQDDEEVQP